MSTSYGQAALEEAHRHRVETMVIRMVVTTDLDGFMFRTFEGNLVGPFNDADTAMTAARLYIHSIHRNVTL